ncbi:MAG: hypothetical protein RJA63_1636 [Pseudomonadota bacterium]
MNPVEQPIIHTAAEVADILRLKERSLEKRHTWSPAFPKPLSKKPLTWTRAAIMQWIIRRDREQQARVR